MLGPQLRYRVKAERMVRGCQRQAGVERHGERGRAGLVLTR